LERVYAAVARIRIEGAFYRRDIGHRQLSGAKERTEG
jgi:phosphoribosylamine-glycine ligase